MSSQGFRGSGGSLYVYAELPAGESSAIGLDSTDSGKFKIQALTTAGALPTGTVQLTIDPSTNGNVTLNPNGTGSVSVTTNVSLPATTSSTVGVISIGSAFVHGYGTGNTFIGKSSGNFSLTTGSATDNTAIGANSLSAIGTGSANLVAGFNAGINYTTVESNNVLLAHAGVALDSGVIRIGTSGTQNTCYISGVSGVTVVNQAYVTMNTSTGQLGTTAGGALLGWIVVAGAAQNMAVNFGYIANHGSTLTFTLPAVSNPGDMVRVSGLGGGGWTIHQNGGNTINYGSAQTTAGAGGSISSTNQHDAVELLCVTANALWNVLSSQGNLTVV